MGVLILLKTKDEVFKRFQEWKAMVENELHGEEAKSVEI